MIGDRHLQAEDCPEGRPAHLEGLAEKGGSRVVDLLIILVQTVWLEYQGWSGPFPCSRDDPP